MIATTGSTGAIDVQCTDPFLTQIKISGVTQTNSAGITLSTTTTVGGGNVQLTSNNGGASNSANIGTDSKQTLEVGLSATYTEALKPGDYNFIVNLEVSP